MGCGMGLQRFGIRYAMASHYLRSLFFVSRTPGPASRRTLLRLGLAACVASALAACGGGGPGIPAQGGYKAEIRRTAHGIPHIEAADEKGIGYGVGYAYAQDNFCLLAEHFITVRGERSRHFGEGAAPEPGQGTVPANVASDLFYRFLNDEARLGAAWAGHSAAAQALFKGFAAGYNRYLRETGAAGLPADCKGQPWVRAVDETDLLRLVRDYGALNGLSDMAPFLAQAAPPQANAAAPLASRAAGAPTLRALLGRPHTGSNAIALGSEATDNGQGMLLGNPHLPWLGTLRMYQLHLTIPGRMDVMGASLPGLPIVGIGFTRDFAWTHTTNTAARVVFHQLRLDPQDPTRYLVDGQSLPMARKTVRLDVRLPDGRLQAREHGYYTTEFGPVLVHGELGWDRQHAYTVLDSNMDNHRIADQWLAMNQARSLDDMKQAVLRIVGNPWNNTLAADASGRTLFMSATPTPRVSEAMLAQCRPEGAQAFENVPAKVLRGDTSRCRWPADPAAPQAGIFAGRDLPVLERRDFVQNSNDSAWLTNPHAPLTGFSPLLSEAGTEQGLRTRQGLSWLQAALQPRNGAPTRRVSQDQLQAMVLDNRVYLAQLVLDDMLSLCPGGTRAAGVAASAELLQACTALKAWDRTAGLDAGIGYGYLEDFSLAFLAQAEDVWQVPFDALDPVNTPRGLRVDQPAVAAQVRAAMAASVRNVAARGWSADKRWGDVQGVARGARRIPLHGGGEHMGVYNMMHSLDTTGDGRREVLFGASYLQTVAFTSEGPRARALLAHSQSHHPGSPYFTDQTERFSRREWVDLPFARAQVDAQAIAARSVIAE
jgi:acyl-homoserine-lactone acylase